MKLPLSLFLKGKYIFLIAAMFVVSSCKKDDSPIDDNPPTGVIETTIIFDENWDVWDMSIIQIAAPFPTNVQSEITYKNTGAKFEQTASIQNFDNQERTHSFITSDNCFLASTTITGQNTTANTPLTYEVTIKFDGSEVHKEEITIPLNQNGLSQGFGWHSQTGFKITN